MKKYVLRKGFTIALAFAATALQSQYQLVGNAVQTSAKTYRITEDLQWKNGSIWNTQKIDLNNSFDLLFELYYGNHDDGADGMTFTLQPLATNIGNPGQGLGVGGVKPSVIIEYDTFENTPYDPKFDHIAIEKNGDVNHNTSNNLVAPVQASSTSVDIEDGLWHNTRIKWNAKTQTLEVYFDCVFRTSYTGDIINTVFGGNPYVYYGFTAATGGSHNEQNIRDFHFIETKKIDTTICLGDSLHVDLFGDQSYTWDPAIGISDLNISNPLLFPKVPTQYIVTVAGKCLDTWKDTFNISIAALPIVDLGPDQFMCEGSGSVTFDAANNGSNFLWSTGETSQSISKFAAGEYIVTVSNVNCSANDSVKLTVDPLPLVPAISNKTICFGDPAHIFDAGAGYFSYVWTDKGNGSNRTCSASLAGKYTCIVTNIEGCTDSASALLQIDALPTPTIANHSICEGDPSVVFDAGQGYATYLWSNKGKGSAQSSNGNSPALYTCKVTTSAGCSASTSGTLIVNQTPIITLENEAFLCFDQQEIWRDTLPNIYASVLWSTGEHTNTIAAANAGTITATVTNEASCTASASIVLSNLCSNIELCFPNFFTPNGDGLNDDFRPCGNNGEKINDKNDGFYNENLLRMQFVIYDRWGIKVYENTEAEIPIWDGTTKGAFVTAGTYYWVGKYTDTHNLSHEQSGYVTLIKN